MCIEAYIKTYHYANFDEMYLEFDKKTLALLGDEYDHYRSTPHLMGENYEQFCYLVEIKIPEVAKNFKEMRQPF